MDNKAMKCVVNKEPYKHGYILWVAGVGEIGLYEKEKDANKYCEEINELIAQILSSLPKPSTDREVMRGKLENYLMTTYGRFFEAKRCTNMYREADRILSLMPKVLSELEIGNVALGVAVRDNWCIRGEDITGWMPVFRAISEATIKGRVDEELV